MSDWLIDEEPELLGATLSLLVSWDKREEARELHGDARAVTTATSMTTTVVATRHTEEKKKKVARPRRTNATRERRKEEIDELRRVTAQLQGQLFALQQRREAMLRPHFSGQVIQTTAPIWENMARRQFQSRRRSEELNTKLRGQIADQVQVSEQLMNAIQYAMQRQTLQEKAPKARVAIDISQRMSEEEQLERLDHHFPRWQWAMSLSPKIEQGELEFLDFNIGESDGFTATMDVYTSYALPDTLETVTRVGWAMLQDEPGDNFDDAVAGEAYVQEVKSDDSLIISVFDSTCTMGGEVPDGGTMCGKWVARRELYDSYHVFVSHWHYELKDFHNELDGVSVEEVMWVRMVDAREIGHAHITGPLTVHQQVRRLEFHFNEKQPVPATRVERVTELFRKQIKDELEMVRGLMESMLLAPALASA